MFKLGTYLGIPVLVVGDLGDGWLLCVWPDKERIKKKQPYTYKNNKAYKHYRSQIKITHEFPENISPVLQTYEDD